MTKTEINVVSVLIGAAIAAVVILVGVMTGVHHEANPGQPLTTSIQGSTLGVDLFTLSECRSTLPLGGC